MFSMKFSVFLIPVILSLLFLSSCMKEEEEAPLYLEEDGVLVLKPYQWRTFLHEEELPYKLGYVIEPIYYNNNVVIPTTGIGGKQQLSLIDSDDGSVLWSWYDYFEQEMKRILLTRFHLFENRLLYQQGGRTYCINIDDGSTHWKRQRNHSFHCSIHGYKGMFFIKGNSYLYPSYDILVGYKGDVYTGDIEVYMVPDFSFEHSFGGRVGDVTEMLPYVIDDVLHLVVIYQEVTSSTYVSFQSYMGLFNMETEEWVYDRVIMNEPSAFGVSSAPPVIYNGKLYANIGRYLVCHDIYSGEQVWARGFTVDFMFSGFIIEDDMLLANCEDTRLYRLDPEDGEIIWDTPSAGTSSRMSYLNGVVYYVGGSTERLHAVDVINGNILWMLDAGLIKDEVFDFRTSAIYTIPGAEGEKGRVIAYTSLYVYSFEAYR